MKLHTILNEQTDEEDPFEPVSMRDTEVRLRADVRELAATLYISKQAMSVIHYALYIETDPELKLGYGSSSRGLTFPNVTYTGKRMRAQTYLHLIQTPTNAAQQKKLSRAFREFLVAEEREKFLSQRIKRLDKRLQGKKAAGKA